ncbi:MAG: hypothetical protein U0872_01410 [Planctomycetaceae bacterium]
MPIRACSLVGCSVMLVMSSLLVDVAAQTVPFRRIPGMTLKTESFRTDPGWEGINHRAARNQPPRTIRQDFGFSPDTHHAGGRSPGELGGFVSPAGEAAFYAKEIASKGLDQPLSASGTLFLDEGGTNLLLGFFNAETVKEWRTPSSIAIRLNGRGDKFFAYVEYCTAKWRAGGDTTPFPSVTDPNTGRWSLIGFPIRTSLNWSLHYDPKGNDGRGVVTAIIGDARAVCLLDESHQSDGATFNRFGILNVVKSADSGSKIWLDDIVINGAATEEFSADPQWDGRNNRRTYPSRLVRPWFDFGFSATHFSGGTETGELGGVIYRGDCRDPEKMASYGDRVGPLSLEKPLKAAGKLAMTRGVTDSTVLFGFYNSVDSLRSNNSQSDSVPESVLGIHVEGPSSDGFHVYPVLRSKNAGGAVAPLREFPFIQPDGKSHDWGLDYDPAAEEGRGRITVSLDGQAKSWTLPVGLKTQATAFDRFGIVTSWIDGNGQEIYWDDVTYTQSQD